MTGATYFINHLPEELGQVRSGMLSIKLELQSQTQSTFSLFSFSLPFSPLSLSLSLSHSLLFFLQGNKKSKAASKTEEGRSDHDPKM
jgi:hypothetical protein